MTNSNKSQQQRKIEGKNIFYRIREWLGKVLLDEDATPLPSRSGKEYFFDYLFLVIVATTIVVLDQLSKNWVRTTIPFGNAWMPNEWIAQYARLVNWSNTGAAFGIFQNGSLIFTILAFIVAIIILIYYSLIPPSEKIQRLTLAMMLGGAIGNLFDRLKFGEVTDFISVGKFPVFNVADSSITVGVSLLILAYFIEWRKMSKEEKS